MAPPYISSAYLICSGMRTGSNLIATALRQTRIAGRPETYFDIWDVDQPWMREALGVPQDVKFTSFADWFDIILRAGTKNCVFGAKVHWHHLDDLVAAVQSADRHRPEEELVRPADALRAFFPNLRFIWLRRENLVAQGISHYLAVKTNRWIVPIAKMRSVLDERR